jgi:hypothetical protein
MPQARAELAVPARTAGLQEQLPLEGLYEAGAAPEEREGAWADQLTSLAV